MRRLQLAVLVCLLPGTWAGASAAAQGFPARPVRYILPLPAGQETDVFARVFANRIGEIWGQQVIVDNRPGGGTVIGADVAAKAQPNGYTLLHALTSHAINATLFAKLPYDTLRDFACVTQIGSFSSVLISHPSFPAKTVPELITLAKAQPGKIVYGTGPIGTSNHILGEAFRLAAGIDIGHVPYKGGGPAIQDLVAGRLPLVGNVVLEVLPFVRSGKARAIAVTGPKRTASLPDVPTVAESLPNYRAGTSFWVLVTRSGAPPALMKQIHAGVAKAMQAPDVRERFAQMDIEPIGSAPAQCDAFLREQVAVWGEIVKASGARAD
jgi:tripartite-type tricarboxylate transporter receptor subunit TctC